MPTYRTSGYTLAQIDAYRAVLFYEAKRRGADLNDPKSVAMVTMMAAGLNGKSALLERIARGERVMVVAPPVAMSYPWYSVMESDETCPIGLWMDAGNVKDLLAQGKEMRDSLRGLTAKALEQEDQDKGHGQTDRGKNLRLFMGDGARQIVLIKQGQWEVVAVGGNGLSLDVSQPSWLERGFSWRLSLDVIPATESSLVICAHHDPKGGKITTIQRLELEGRWHVNELIKNLQAAADPQLAQAMLDEAKAKDEESMLRAGKDRDLSVYSSVEK